MKYAKSFSIIAKVYMTSQGALLLYVWMPLADIEMILTVVCG
jgi:hypothetical protein